jgi:hypothetical protein
MASVLIRGAIVAGAGLVVAWCVLSYRGVGIEEDAEQLAARASLRALPAEVIEDAREDLRSAGRFSADNTALLTEGSLLSASRRRAEGAAIARRATEEEPDNVVAWILAYATAPDAAERAAAKREVARLNPWAADELP